jgi:hypothetical protein
MKKLLILLLMTTATFSTGFSQTCSDCAATGWSISITQGTTKTYSVPALTGATYVWIVTGGLQIISGQGTNTVTVKGNTAGSGSLYVTRYKAGVSACANYISISIPTAATPPAMPSGISIIIEPCETVGIYANQVANATGYKFYIDGVLFDSGPFSSIFVGLTNPPQLSIGTHTVCISAYNAYGTSGQTCKSFTVDCTGGAGGGVGDPVPAVIAVPNPADDALTLSTLSDEIKIYDSQGFEVKKIKSLNSKTIDISDLKPGAYILKSSKNGVVKSQRIIVE